jgi:hypothetical protein
LTQERKKEKKKTQAKEKTKNKKKNLFFSISTCTVSKYTDKIDRTEELPDPALP